MGCSKTTIRDVYKKKRLDTIGIASWSTPDTKPGRATVTTQPIGPETGELAGGPSIEISLPPARASGRSEAGCKVGRYASYVAVALEVLRVDEVALPHP